MSSVLRNKIIPLSVVEPEVVYILLDVAPVFGYDSNGVKTDVITGYQYVVVNTNSFNQYKVRVLNNSPLMTREQLVAIREKGGKIYVEFENLSVRMYWNTRSQEYSDTFKADGIQQVDEEIQLN